MIEWVLKTDKDIIEIDKRMSWEDEEKCREMQMNEPQKKSLKIRLKSLSRLQSLRKNQE